MNIMKYLSLVFIFLALPLAAEKRLEAKTPVVFRLDDFWASNDEDRYYVEKRIIEIHEKYHAPLVVCVTPMRIAENRTEGKKIEGLKEDEKRINLLKQSLKSGVVEIALHGHSHACLTKKADWKSPGLFRNSKSEFRGIPKDQQDQMINEAKNSLEELLGMPVRIFVPPWSTYDRNTVDVLEKYNFEIFSPWYLGEPQPKDSRLTFIDCWLDPSAEEIEYVLKMAESENDFPPVIIAIHPFDVTESDDPRAIISLDEYEKLVKQVVESSNLESVNFNELAKNTPALENQKFNRIAGIQDDLQLNHYINRVGRNIPGAIAPFVKSILSILGGITGFRWLVPTVYLLAALAGYLMLSLLKVLLNKYHRAWMGISAIIFMICMIIMFKDHTTVVYLSKSFALLIFSFGVGSLFGGCTVPVWGKFSKKVN